MRSPEKQKDRLQIPLMFAFRDAYEKRDAAKPEDVRVDGERVVADRATLRRRGTDESHLKRDLAIDLAALVDTVSLASSIDLSGRDFVRKSVLNYGLDDLTHITLESHEVDAIGDQLKTALLRHEPRLSADTLHVERADTDEVNQRVRFKVRADMLSKPLDIPIEFVAEVDVGSGKVIVPRTIGTA
jgi:type VI secretion system protein ImpF